ncbi:MAG: tetratricopeptide repeat protein [Planctomycetales bacterium]|nr:tetratricopeptide repeat protein [Planctomycetales bacterium]
MRRELSQLASNAGSATNGHASPSARGARLLVVIDPLEEVFTRPGSTKEDRERFFAALHVLAGSGLVWILSTMRSDFYERCGEHPLLLTLKEGKGQYHLAPPTSVEISHMIRLPAQLAALQFENDPERGTLDEVLKEAATADPAALPLLQFTLDEIYKKSNAEQTGLLTFAAYDELGGMTGALRTRAEETIEEVRRQLGDRTEATFSTVFSALVGLNPDADRTVVRLYAYLDRICVHPDCRLLVDTLIAARLFITDIDDEEKPVVTICHEAMLKHWPRLAEWIDGNRDFLRTRARIASGANRWIEEGRQEAFLLQEGKPLAEGWHLLERRGDLTNLEIEYIEASQTAAKARRRKRRLRNQVIVATLLVISVAALVGWSISFSQFQIAQSNFERAEKLAIDEKEQRTNATQRAHDAQKLVEFLLEDLRKSLAPDQKRDAEIIEKISKKVLEHYNRLDPDKDTDDIKLEHAQNLLSVALIFEKMARFSEANELAAESRKLREGVLKPNDPLIADCLQLEGLCHNQLGDYKAAESNYLKAIGIYEKSANPKSKAAGVAFGRQGELCRQFGRFVEAEHWHQRGIAILEQEQGAKAFEVGLRYNDLGELYRNWGKLDRSHECFDKALAIIGSEPIQDLRKLGDVKGNFGVLLSEQGDHDKGEAMLRDALKTDKTAVGEQNAQVGADLYKLARVLTAAKKYDDAKSDLASSFAILKATVKPNHLRMAKYWEALAELKLAQSKFLEAEEASRKALEIRKEKLVPPHPEIAKAIDQLARVLSAAGRTAESAPFQAEAQAMQREHARREKEAEVRIGQGQDR